MAFAWILHGRCAVLHGFCVGFAWHLRGFCMKFASVTNAWFLLGFRVDFALVLRGFCGGSAGKRGLRLRPISIIRFWSFWTEPLDNFSFTPKFRQIWPPSPRTKSYEGESYDGHWA